MTLFRRFFATDALQLAWVLGGLARMGMEPSPMGLAEAQDLEAHGPAWTALDANGRVLCCAGFWELHHHPETGEAVHAYAWAMLNEGLRPREYLAISRYAEAAIRTSPIMRIEATVRADCEGEVNWALRSGLTAGYVMQGWGPLSLPHVMFERVRS